MIVLAWMLMVVLLESILSIGEYVEVLTCCIHDYVCHWCQKSNNSINISRVPDRNQGCLDRGLMFQSCTCKDMFHTMS